MIRRALRKKMLMRQKLNVWRRKVILLEDGENPWIFLFHGRFLSKVTYGLSERFAGTVVRQGLAILSGMTQVQQHQYFLILRQAKRFGGSFGDPAEGTVRLGGVDVSTVDGEALLKNYAIVFQDVVLFADTVMENIRLGKRDATDEEVLAAAKAAQCDAFVSKLPEGYHTLIGENGSRLSGGERQRISIARAILKDAPVILLDEATASLDVENETAVQAALSGLIKDKTALIIAHRMRTVMNADQIVLLSGGRVAEMGSPAELLKKNGLFRHMAQLQSESMEWTA